MTARGTLLFLALGVVWGIPYLLIRVAVVELSPEVIVGGRCLVGALVLLPFALRQGGIRRTLRYWPAVLAYALVEIAVAQWLLSDAEQHITSSLAGLLIAAVPIFAAVIALGLRIDSRLHPVRLLGLVVGLAGVAALAGLNIGSSAGGWPVLQVLGTALCYAVGPMIITRSLSDLPPAAVNCIALAFCGIGYLPFAVATRPAQAPSAGAIAAVLVLGVVCTAAAFMLLFALVAEIGPAPATVITYVNQAVALGAGVVFLGEPVTLGIAIGFPLVLLGAFLATRGTRRVTEAVAAGA